MEDNLQDLPDILRRLSYDCTHLERLSGGTANFVFRGTRDNDSVIVKHTKDYIASNREFKLPAERCHPLAMRGSTETQIIEESILKSLGNFPATTTQAAATAGPITVKTPRLLAFDRPSYTLVMEDLPKAIDLKTLLTNPQISSRITHPWATSLGTALGQWLGSFHMWTAESAQEELVRAMEGNELMRDLKFNINYENVVGLVDKYPDLLGESRGVFEEVRDLARSELGRKDGEGAAFGVIHGDFWSGNVLIPKDILDQQQQHPDTTVPLFVIDWELAQCGARALDLGQMIAELYFVKHFRDIDAGPWIVEGFMRSYPHLTEAMSYRAAIHVGVHFICWGTMLTDWGTEEQVRQVVALGRDLIVKAWRRERDWFEGGFWGCLFRK